MCLEVNERVFVADLDADRWADRARRAISCTYGTVIEVAHPTDADGIRYLVELDDPVTVSTHHLGCKQWWFNENELHGRGGFLPDRVVRQPLN